MKKYVCIHGHFYQPPRENPWLEAIELQDTAYPYHDWNERITAECYAPNSASRILNQNKKIVDIVNNFARISFNFGPTLLSWMKKNADDIYEAIMEADKRSRDKFSGHGSAIAQAYNHMIMPLANQRDKETQIIWGIKDFEYHFGRKPEGMWLPETAVDLQTLDILKKHGIAFTILSPHQARHIRKIGGKEWKEVENGSIDTTTPYRCALPSGDSITIMFYDGPISHDIGFGDLLRNGESFAKRLVGAFCDDRKRDQIVHIATDGETFGHHHRFGEMALSYCLHYIETNKLADIINYGAFLATHEPQYEVEIEENSSWSCVHGIERWRDNCGCHSGMHPGWNQEWRKPLRETFDWLRDNIESFYEMECSKFLKKCWDVRNDYISVIHNRSRAYLDEFLSKHSLRPLTLDEQIRVLKLLEMQRHAMLMYTSCGWFFDEISGIETVQVIMYAARVVQLLREVGGSDLESEFLNRLSSAPSNIPDFSNGGKVYEIFVKPCIIDLPRVGAHHAISSLFEEFRQSERIYCYSTHTELSVLEEAGRQRMAIGKIKVRSDITYEEGIFNFAVLHFGDHNLNGGVHEFTTEEDFEMMDNDLRNSFTTGDIPETIRLMDRHFGTHNYSLWHLFKDKQREVLDKITESELRDVENLFRQIYEHNYPIMKAMREMKVPLPRVLSTPAELILNRDIQDILKEEDSNLVQLKKLVREIRNWSFDIDATTLAYVAGKRIDTLMERINENPEDLTLLKQVDELMTTIRELPLELNLWKAQNILFFLAKRMFSGRKEKAEQGDSVAKEWVELFKTLEEHLCVSHA